MPKFWSMSDDVRSQMAVAAVDACLHATLARSAVEALVAKAPSKELTHIGGYLSHILSTLNTIDEALRNKVKQRRDRRGSSSR